MKRLWFLLLASAFLATGCSSLSGLAGMSTPAAPHCGDPRSMVLIIGAHRNAPAPSLDPGLVCQVTAAIRAGLPVQIVVPSGQPLLTTPRLVSVQGGTLAQQNSPRVRQDVQRVQAAVAAARPDSPGVDDLAALAVAADQARSAGDPHAELVLIDPGLDDRGALAFTAPGTVAANPAEVARQLKASGNLPDFRGFAILLVGIGYTAPPQAPLPAKWRSNVTQIWATVLRSAGAAVEIIPQPGQGPSVKTDQPVRAVPVPPTQPVWNSGDSTFVFPDSGPVGFDPDTAAFRDPPAAHAALRRLAGYLAANSSARIELTGTTARWGSLAGCIALAQQRANTVKAVLVRMGARRSQTVTRGLGWRFPGYENDQGPDGTLVPGPAEHNRSVIVTRLPDL